MPGASIPYDFIELLKSLPGVDAIYLFGSRARGDHHERSDIDIAVVLRQDNDKQWNEVLAIIDEADTLLTIDCVNLNRVDEAFRKRILGEGKLLYERAD